MTPGSSKPNDEAQVRAVIDGWAKAIGAKDIDAVMSHYAADIVTFDLAPPLQPPAPMRSREPGGVVPHVPGSSRLRGPRPLRHDGR
jgi:hypothetical protein